MADILHSLNLHQIIDYLNNKLGPTLVAASIGYKDRRGISENVENFEKIFSAEQKTRLQFTLDTWLKVVAAEGDSIARLWFIGANPWLDDQSVIENIREDRFNKVNIAVDALVNDAPAF